MFTRLSSLVPVVTAENVAEEELHRTQIFRHFHEDLYWSQSGGNKPVGPGVKVDVLASIVATYRGNSVACHLFIKHKTHYLHNSLMFPQHWPGCQWSSPWCRPRLWRARRGSSPQSRVWSCRPRSWPCSGCTYRCPPRCRCWDTLNIKCLMLQYIFDVFTFHTLSKVFLVSVLGEKRSSHSLDDV